MPWKQLRPFPQADPGFRLNPDGTARFQYAGHLVDVLVRYTTEEDRDRYTALARGDEVIVFASVDVGGVTVGSSWMLAEWHNPYSLRDGLLYVLREAIDQAERKVDAMAVEVAEIRTKRQGVAQ
ncbi:hypothetical protein [Streptomyces sp. NPDC001165]|uniref:hypothetical protein n=1 Tax=Streptomyces sp. NPDC001165 TaxID=3364546 RepID=UPI0036C7C21C